MSNPTFRQRLMEYVQTEEFFQALVNDVERTDNAEKSFKMRLELLSYLEPKVKTVDHQGTGANRDIIITFLESGVAPPGDDE